MNKEEKILGLIGLCMKAGQLVSGAALTEDAVKDKSVKVVLFASDASDRTKKDITNACQYFGVPFYECSDMEHLGHHIGKEQRAVVGIKNPGLAEKIIKYLESEEC